MNNSLVCFYFLCSSHGCPDAPHSDAAPSTTTSAAAVVAVVWPPAAYATIAGDDYYYCFCGAACTVVVSNAVTAAYGYDVQMICYPLK